MQSKAPFENVGIHNLPDDIRSFVNEVLFDSHMFSNYSSYSNSQFSSPLKFAFRNSADFRQVASLALCATWWSAYLEGKANASWDKL